MRNHLPTTLQGRQALHRLFWLTSSFAALLLLAGALRARKRGCQA